MPKSPLTPVHPSMRPYRDAGRQLIALVLVFVSVFAVGPPVPLFAQSQSAAAPMMLHITILDGEDALNNIRERTAREPVVQVEDENHKPVAGALILFSIQNGGSGAGGTFNGLSSLSVTTDAEGKAVAHGLEINATAGSYSITVTATLGALAATAVIHQSIVAGGGTESTTTEPAAPPAAVAQTPEPAAGGGGPGSSSAPSRIGQIFRHIPKKVWVSGTVVVATGVVVGVVVATRGNSSTTITPGTGTVGP